MCTAQFLCLNFRPTQNQFPNSDFVFLPPKDPLAGQPNVEGLIPINMAVAVSSFKLLKDTHGLPLLFQGYPTGY